MKFFISILAVGLVGTCAWAAKPQAFRVVNGADSYSVEFDKSFISLQGQKIQSRISKQKCGKAQVTAMQKILETKLKRLVEVKVRDQKKVPFYIQKDEKKFLPAPGTAGRVFFESLPGKIYAFQLALKRTCKK